MTWQTSRGGEQGAGMRGECENTDVLHLAALRHRAAGTAGAVRGAAGVGLTAHVVVRAAVRQP